MNPLPSAVFLDRDDTIIRDMEYISRPDQVEILAGACQAISRINTALVPVIVVTNQSGLNRGYFTQADYEAVKQRVDDLLAECGAHIDASYFCPHRPEEQCECRKPGTLLFEQASREHGIDLSRALYIGNRYSDIEAGIRAGGHAVLIPTSFTPVEEIERAKKTARVAGSLAQAVDWYVCTN